MDKHLIHHQQLITSRIPNKLGNILLRGREVEDTSDGIDQMSAQSKIHKYYDIFKQLVSSYVVLKANKSYST